MTTVAETHAIEEDTATTAKHLELAGLTIRTRLIRRGDSMTAPTARRLVVTIHECRIATVEWAQVLSWFERFYNEVAQRGIHFCVIFDIRAPIDDMDRMRELTSLFAANRTTTQRWSIATCVVTPTPMLALVAQTAMAMYGTTGTVYFPDTLRQAKDICLDAVELLGGTGTKQVTPG